MSSNTLALQKKSSFTKTLKKPFKSKKVGLLKQNVAELQASLRDTTEQLKKAKNDISTLSKEMEDLQSTFDDMKVEHATNIDDLMEKMMEQQIARANEKKAAEEKLETLQQEYEQNIMIIQAEGDAKAEQLREQMTKQIELEKEEHEKHKEEIMKFRDLALTEYEKDIAAYEKERRSVKRLIKLTRKSVTRKIFGPSEKEKAAVKKRGENFQVLKKEIERSSQRKVNTRALEELNALAPTAPVIVEAAKDSDDAVVIELGEDFGDKTPSAVPPEEGEDEAAEVEDEEGEEEEGEAEAITETETAEKEEVDETKKEEPEDMLVRSAKHELLWEDLKGNPRKFGPVESFAAGMALVTKAGLPEPHTWSSVEECLKWVKVTEADDDSEAECNEDELMRSSKHGSLYVDLEGNPRKFGPASSFKHALEVIKSLGLPEPHTWSPAEKVAKWEAPVKEAQAEKLETSEAPTEEATEDGEAVENNETMEEEEEAEPAPAATKNAEGLKEETTEEPKEDNTEEPKEDTTEEPKEDTTEEPSDAVAEITEKAEVVEETETTEKVETAEEPTEVTEEAKETTEATNPEKKTSADSSTGAETLPDGTEIFPSPKHNLLKVDAKGNPKTFGPFHSFKAGMDEVMKLELMPPATWGNGLLKW